MTSESTTERTIFISCSKLKFCYKRVPEEEMENALFLFGSKKCWIFPENEEQIADSKRQPTNYLALDPDFKALLQKKLNQGLLHFLKPDDMPYDPWVDNGHPDAYKNASEWLKTITDPTTGKNYPGLQIDQTWWTEEFPGGDFLNKSRGNSVSQLIEEGSHGYEQVMQLIKTSIPSLNPKLAYW